MDPAAGLEASLISGKALIMPSESSFKAVRMLSETSGFERLPPSRNVRRRLNDELKA
jgi:hypothetical protein